MNYQQPPAETGYPQPPAETGDPQPPAETGAAMKAMGMAAFAWAVVAILFIILWARATCRLGRFSAPRCKDGFTDGCSGVMSPAAEAELAALTHLGAHPRG